MVDDTHTAWVERMAQLMAPATTSRPGTLGGSMDSLQRQIEDNCRKLGSPGPRSQAAASSPPPPPAALRDEDAETASVARAASPKMPGLSSEVPGPLGEQLTGFMERLKEDLSKDLVRQLAALSKSDREDQDRKTAELFESVEQERRKIERLEDRLIYGAPASPPPPQTHGRRKSSAGAARLSQEQQDELLPLLDQIERTILTDCSLAASGRHTVVVPAPRAPPAWQPPPPAGPPPARFAAAASTGGGGGGGGGGGMSRRHSREVEDRKRHFNASFGSSQPTLPPPPPGARFAGSGGFERETESVCSRSSATSGRREVVEPHTLRQHLGWQTRESPPPPLPPPPPGPPPPPPQAGTGPPPPPPQHPHATSPYLRVVGGRVPPRGGDGYARQHQQQQQQQQQPPPPPGPPPSHYVAPQGPPPPHPPSDLYGNPPDWYSQHAGPSDELVEHQSCYSPDRQAFAGSNWEIEESELTIY